MKRQLFFGAMMLAMVACSKDAATPEQGAEPNLPAQEELSKASYNVGGGDQARVRNYAYAGLSTRSLGFVMPEYPTIPADAVDVTGFEENDVRNAGPVIKITGKHTNKINSWNNQTLYLAPEAEVECAIEGNLIVYILKGAKMTFTADNISSIQGIYNWGDFTATGNFSLNSYPFYSAVPVEFNGKLTFPSGAQYYCQQETKAKGIYVNSGAKVESCAFIVEDDSDKYLSGLNQWGGIDWDATGVLEFAGGNLDFHTSYIQAGMVKFNSNNNLHLTLEANGRIDTKYLQVDPKQNDQKIVTLGEKAVVCAENVYLQQMFQQNENKLLPNFGVGVRLQDVVSIYENGQANDPKEYDIPTDGGINSDDFTMNGSKCSPGYNVQPGTDPEPEPEPEPSLDLVTEVESPTHDHDSDKDQRHLSATSLTFDGNGKIYASYHMRGGNWGGDTYDKDDIEGCIEGWSFTGEQVTIGNWMWTNEFDFNHILLDGNQVVTVGHKGEGNKDFGAIIGKLPVDVWARNWDATDELTREDFAYKYLTTEEELLDENGKKLDYKNAGDGNCVVKVGDNYFVTASAGYGVIDANFQRIKDEEGNVLFCSTPGSAKYLAVEGDNAYVLYLNDRPTGSSLQTTSFGATLAKMSVNDFPAAGATTEMANNVSPVDGKNVIAVDNGVVYACLSNGGLQIGSESPITFDQNDEKRPVNGVAVDEKYIYVANGCYISVLDKATKQLVVERKGHTEKVSANFVEVKEYNGKKYVFVAFGQEGIKVFEFKA